MIVGDFTLTARTRPELEQLVQAAQRAHGPRLQLRRPYQVNGGWRVQGTLSVRTAEEEIDQAGAIGATVLKLQPMTPACASCGRTRVPLMQADGRCFSCHARARKP